jgi:hypothetical protein
MIGKSLNNHDSDLARKSAEASALTVFEDKYGQNFSSVKRIKYVRRVP